MGLHATVFCNCYELGRLRTQPPHPESVYIDEDGDLCCRNRLQVNEFDQWRQNACEHEWGRANHHYIGNIALVAFLRKKLGGSVETFPLILNKVIYNGIHGGDYIQVDEVEKIQCEVINLRTVHSENHDDENLLRRFEVQMSELVACSLEMKKPIVF